MERLFEKRSSLRAARFPEKLKINNTPYKLKCK